MEAKSDDDIRRVPLPIYAFDETMMLLNKNYECLFTVIVNPSPLEVDEIN